MNLLQLKIVGLPYSKDLNGQIDKFLAEVEGRAMTIRPESSNDNDKAAIRAYDWVGTNKWKFFEQLWHRNNMRGDYTTALDQRESLKF